MVTFAQLQQSTTQSLLSGADAARKLARELEQFGAETDRLRRGLSAGWSGDDATAAGTKLTEHVTGYRNAATSYGRIDQIVSTLVGEMNAAKQQLESAVSAAPSIPGRVDGNGTVYVNWEALGPQPSAAAVATAKQNAMKVAGWIRDAVTRANTADQNAAGQLSAVTGGAVPAPSTAGATVPAEGTDPAKVKEWWDGLSQQQREALIAADPKAVGGLDGVPIAVRDQANRLALTSEMDSVGGQLSAAREELSKLSPGSPHDLASRQEYQEAASRVRELDQRWDNLNSVKDQLGRTDLQGSTEKLHLIDYDSASDGKLVMSVGNPDTADNVLTFVPGMTTDVEGIGTSMDYSLRMQADAAANLPGSSTASVMWLGYDAPDGVFGAANDNAYRAAAGDLTTFQHGLRATHEGPASLNTLLGHSYGSSTVGYAASQADLRIDNLVFVASPGATVDSAGDFQGIGADHVFATRGSDDIIRHVPEWFHGNDPVDADFGGRVFPGGDGGHSDYWNPGNPAREGIADIVTGQSNQLPITLQDPSVLRPESVRP
ncbi:alpha/beta hydrolase [Stackebrandtia nassauensis]|uniref:DUF1023 domain-containing protein n=1 Tax=Stackebrandtia nassauensis (strain DSM 44728 / CIP 108903 / NRRL B-16338 / NBRC 102104 / LLR-40K-21) TaxID=446470 RepID=D3Q4G9_STANL|nr:alpha/beta hydrolase [Stackebrandtia nassauensis]ADD40129.1 protein of unknown function DUF1023 [Stackebrandtia nassauensis DSM 44728]